jgi:hypothetical protein
MQDKRGNDASDEQDCEHIRHENTVYPMTELLIYQRKERGSRSGQPIAQSHSTMRQALCARCGSSCLTVMFRFLRRTQHLSRSRQCRSRSSRHRGCRSWDC